MPDTGPSAVHETVLYADDLEATTTFYAEVIGLRRAFGPTPALSALRVGDGTGLLLLFDPTHSTVPGRDVPHHGARGEGHIAFSVDDATLAAIRARCDDAGVEVEREITWPRGGRSVYVRDPAANSVELIVGEIWPD